MSCVNWPVRSARHQTQWPILSSLFAPVPSIWVREVEHWVQHSLLIWGKLPNSTCINLSDVRKNGCLPPGRATNANSWWLKANNKSKQCCIAMCLLWSMRGVESAITKLNHQWQLELSSCFHPKRISFVIPNLIWFRIRFSLKPGFSFSGKTMLQNPSRMHPWSCSGSFNPNLNVIALYLAEKSKPAQTQRILKKELMPYSKTWKIELISTLIMEVVDFWA